MQKYFVFRFNVSLRFQQIVHCITTSPFDSNVQGHRGSLTKGGKIRSRNQHIHYEIAQWLVNRHFLFIEPEIQQF
jgi:hypothetical protein